MCPLPHRKRSRPRPPAGAAPGRLQLARHSPPGQKGRRPRADLRRLVAARQRTRRREGLFPAGGRGQSPLLGLSVRRRRAGADGRPQLVAPRPVRLTPARLNRCRPWPSAPRYAAYRGQRPNHEAGAPAPSATPDPRPKRRTDRCSAPPHRPASAVRTGGEPPSPCDRCTQPPIWAALPPLPPLPPPLSPHRRDDIVCAPEAGISSLPGSRLSVGLGFLLASKPTLAVSA